MTLYCKNCYELKEQLQAKEQECKKLQFTLKHVGLLDLMNENNELKQECEALEKRVQAEIHLGNKYNEDFAEQAAIAQKLEQTLDDIEKIVKQTCRQRCTNECLGTRKHCGYGSVLNIINKTKESK